jgi:membrane protease subunit HflK
MDLNFSQPDRDPRRVARASIHRNWRNLWGAFNLNDPRWGRGDDADREDKNAGDEGVNRPDDEGSRPNRDQRPSRGQVPNQGPPDLDELWRDFNRKLGGSVVRGWLGWTWRLWWRGACPASAEPEDHGIGAGLIAMAVLIWLGRASSSCKKVNKP